jgi:hypothetical protein
MSAFRRSHLVLLLVVSSFSCIRDTRSDDSSGTMSDTSTSNGDSSSTETSTATETTTETGSEDCPPGVFDQSAWDEACFAP